MDGGKESLGMLLLYSAFFASASGLSCQHCDRVTSLSACQNTTCDTATEDCFVDELVTDLLDIVWSAGCRSKQACGSSPVTSGLGKRDLVACSRCCGSNDCNTNMCGLQYNKTFVPQKPSGLSCRHCDRVTSLSACQNATCDTATEDCFVDELVTDLLDIVWSAGCRSKQACGSSAVTSGLGKRDLVACSRCCSSNDCNTNMCGLQYNKTFVPQKPSGAICRHCQQSTNISTCATALCDLQTEMCFVDKLITATLEIKYEAGCRARDGCLKASSALGKRDVLVVCSRCCDGDDCNSKFCQ